MKRNWDIVRSILEHAESDDLLNFAQSGAYLSECGII